MTSFLHSPAWQRFQETVGRAVLRQDDQLYIQRTLPFGDYFTCSRCLWGIEHGLPRFAKRPFFVRLEPIDERSCRNLLGFAEQRRLPLRATASVQPRQTSVLDITRPPAEILGRMHPKHRYNIRLAEKRGVEVRTYSDGLVERFERFWALLTSTAGRHRFRTHGRRYYRTMLRELERDKMAHLVIASAGGGDLAAMILITHQGTATYLHGASGAHLKQLMAPHLMHWRALNFAKDLGCAVYDLWGTDAVYDPGAKRWRPRAGEPSAGTTRFKLGFGGTITNYPGAYDLILRPLYYTVYARLRAWRSRRRAFR